MWLFSAVLLSREQCQPSPRWPLVCAWSVHAGGVSVFKWEYLALSQQLPVLTDKRTVSGSLSPNFCLPFPPTLPFLSFSPLQLFISLKLFGKSACETNPSQGHPSKEQSPREMPPTSQALCSPR